VRRDNRATAIAIALASTARPASCPPISRESSGNVDETVVALTFGSLLPFGVLVLALADGVTVGNSPDGSPSPLVVAMLPSLRLGTYVPGIPSPTPLSVDDEPEPDVELEAAVTSIVALASADVAFVALTVAVSVIFSPSGAASRTRTAATSSSLWLVGKAPTVQTSPLASEQTLKYGDCTCAALPRLTETVAPSASATVLQTKIS
jgi:hypothetical protein